MATLPLASALATAGWLIALGASAIVLPLLIRARQVARWRRCAPDLLALTYDDGPDNTTTPAVLELLDELGVPATFILVGFRSGANPHASCIIKNTT